MTTIFGSFLYIFLKITPKNISNIVQINSIWYKINIDFQLKNQKNTAQNLKF